MNKDKKLELSYSLLREAERKIPAKTTQECMQISEKAWAAFAQATKAYKSWKTDRAYSSVIGELYQNYPQYEEDIRQAHRTARALHTDDFYEGIASPTKKDIVSIEKGIKTIESILGIRSQGSGESPEP